jgi:pyridoxine 5'-phosphate synthase PdxJ
MTLAPDAMSWLDAHGGEFVYAVSPECMPLAPHARTDCKISLPAEHTSKTTRGAGNDGANGLELHTGHSAARSLLFVS